MQIRGGRKERRRGRSKVEEGEKTKGGKVRRPGEKVRKRKRQNRRQECGRKEENAHSFVMNIYKVFSGIQS